MVRQAHNVREAMFTGLVESKATITTVTELPEGRRLHIGVDFAHEITDGESIAVNGVCLTVADQDDSGFVADIMPGTMRVTTLGELQQGSFVNVERAVRVETRLGGHIVQGHVDGVGTVLERRSLDKWDEITIQVPDGLERYIVSKGSITVEGVSLTVAAIDGNHITIGLIPTTQELTTLGSLTHGSRVNLEVDVLAKYVEKLLGQEQK